MYKLRFDNHDIAILSELQKSARISLSELHTRVGMSIPAVTERIRKMEARGIIRGYRALVDAKSLGIGLTAFISVAIDDPRRYAVFAEEVAKLKDIQECHHVVGEFDYLLKVKTEDTLSLESLISKKLRVIPGVGRTRTTVVLSSPIEDTHLNLTPVEEASAAGETGNPSPAEKPASSKGPTLSRGQTSSESSISSRGPTSRKTGGRQK